MRKRSKILLLIVGAATAAGLTVAIGLYRATQVEPEFYKKSLALPPAAAARGSDEFLHRATELAGAAPKEGRWEQSFTDEQVNGWLAVDFVENHARHIPSEVSDPRVEIRPDAITLACRYEKSKVSTVFSLDVEPYLAEPDLIAFRIRGAKAGAMPVPLERLLTGISKAALKINLRLKWVQEAGDPIALVSLPPLDDRGEMGGDQRRITLDQIELRPGELYVAGRTVATPTESDSAATPQSPPEPDQAATNSTRQR